jgi:hypothetical protein
MLSFLVVACLSFAFWPFNWFPFAVHAPLGAQLGGLAIILLSVGAFYWLQIRCVRSLVANNDLGVPDPGSLVRSFQIDIAIALAING